MRWRQARRARGPQETLVCSSPDTSRDVAGSAGVPPVPNEAGGLPGERERTGTHYGASWLVTAYPRRGSAALATSRRRASWCVGGVGMGSMRTTVVPLRWARRFDNVYWPMVLWSAAAGGVGGLAGWALAEPLAAANSPEPTYAVYMGVARYFLVLSMAIGAILGGLPG